MVLAPENTRAAFDIALEHRADVLEIDVRLSRDGVVFVTHDATVDRTTSGQGLVASLSASEIESLDAGHAYPGEQGDYPWRARGLRLMRLADLYAAYPDTRINIDIKDNTAEASARVAAVIRDADAVERSNVGSFHRRTLNAFRAIAPEISTAAGHLEVAQLYFSPARRLPTLKLACRCLQIPTRWHGINLASEAFIRRGQSLGLQMIYWTVNDVATMRTLVERGVDGIVSDRADLLAEILQPLRPATQAACAISSQPSAAANRSTISRSS